MKLTVYRVLLGIAIIWQFYLTVPDRSVMFIFRAFPGAFIFNIIFDVGVVTLLVVGLVKDTKRSKSGR